MRAVKLSSAGLRGTTAFDPQIEAVLGHSLYFDYIQHDQHEDSAGGAANAAAFGRARGGRAVQDPD